MRTAGEIRASALKTILTSKDAVLHIAGTADHPTYLSNHHWLLVEEPDCSGYHKDWLDLEAKACQMALGAPHQDFRQDRTIRNSTQYELPDGYLKKIQSWLPTLEEVLDEEQYARIDASNAWTPIDEYTGTVSAFYWMVFDRLVGIQARWAQTFIRQRLEMYFQLQNNEKGEKPLILVLPPFRRPGHTKDLRAVVGLVMPFRFTAERDLFPLPLEEFLAWKAENYTD